MQPIELTRRAERDLRRLDAQTRRRVWATLDALAADAPSLDTVPLAGKRPWRRIRVGDYRVLYRASDPQADEPEEAYLIHRVVHRRDLERAVANL